MTYLIGGTVAVILYVLWSRRFTIFVGWEVGPTVMVLGMALCMFLIPPYMANIVGPPLRAVTRLCNAEDLIGHLAYLVGLGALLHTMINRLDMPNRERFIRTRLELPAVLGLPVLIGAFLLGSPDQPIADSVADSIHYGGEWLKAYWLLLCCASGWIMGHLIWTLDILRRDPRSAVVANLYLIALLLDSFCVAWLFGHVILHGPAWPAWLYPASPDSTPYSLRADTFLATRRSS